MNLHKYQKQLLLFSFLAIPVTLLLLFVVYPFLRLLQLSFTNWDGISKTFAYLGLDNYHKLFWNSPEVWIRPIFGSMPFLSPWN